jgi:hypothetical protein
MDHVSALANDIGPRPAGSPQEQQARAYIQKTLHEMGLTDVESIPFLTNDTWGHSLIFPILVGLAGNLFRGKWARLPGAALSLFGAYALWRAMKNQAQLFFPLYPKGPSATLLSKIKPSGEGKQRVVLIGHTDSNKHRASFSPTQKHNLRASTTLGTLLPFANGLAQLAQAVGFGGGATLLQRLTCGGMAATLAVCLNDEVGGFVPGANDNATAVACLLGLGAWLKDNPLRQTEVWLAFTGAEEVGLFGTHALLDKYGDELRDAWFIDFEMVGSQDIAFVTQHSGLSYLGVSYRPDAESLAWAEETSKLNPDLHVTGRPLVINEEVAALLNRGYRGICLVGYGADGYLENWHQYADNVANINPSGLETAARFALAMLETLDKR